MPASSYGYQGVLLKSNVLVPADMSKAIKETRFNV